MPVPYTSATADCSVVEHWGWMASRAVRRSPTQSAGHPHAGARNNYIATFPLIFIMFLAALLLTREQISNHVLLCFSYSVDLDALSARRRCFVNGVIEDANHLLASGHTPETGIADSNITLFMHLRRHLTFEVDKLKIVSRS
jgi:hypothetical protein